MKQYEQDVFVLDHINSYFNTFLVSIVVNLSY